jgi:hypothetical protein
MSENWTETSWDTEAWGRRRVQIPGSLAELKEAFMDGRRTKAEEIAKLVKACRDYDEFYSSTEWRRLRREVGLD